MGRERKSDLRPLSMLEEMRTRLTTEILGKSDNPRLIVRVRATLQTDSYVRVAEATLEYQALAESFFRQLRMRLLEGLDPLAGMDPVETAHLGDDGEWSHVETPPFVRSAIALGVRY